MPCQLIHKLALAFAALHLALIGTAAAGSDTLATRLIEQYDVWFNKQDKVLSQSAIAIIAGGKVIAQTQFGKTHATKPEPVASLSKSITGLCIVRLVEGGKLRYSDRVGVLLNRYFNRIDEAPADKRFAMVSVAQLLTHTSGITDVWIPGQVPLAEQFRTTMRKKLKTEPGTSHHYENANYQVLGLIIEEVTGEAYAKVCHRLVLAPRGITSARISKLYTYSSSWAGWEISAHDIALLLGYFDPRLKLTETSFDQWPKYDFKDRWFYSAGIYLRHNEDGSYSARHTGVWTWFDRKTGKDQFAARMVMFGTGIGFAVVMRNAPDGLAEDLEHEIWKASLPFGKPDLQ